MPHALQVDGVLSVEIASILSMGNGEFVGLDSSKSMIGAARKLAAEKGLEGKKCSFDGKVDDSRIRRQSHS